jgi:hypothetical protein
MTEETEETGTGLFQITNRPKSGAKVETTSTPENRELHRVGRLVKELVGIPESEEATLLIHVTNEPINNDIQKHGFVNVSGRGTLARIDDNPHPDEDVGVPSIVMSKTSRNKKTGFKTTMITFCLPVSGLKQDGEKYGMWYDNRLKEGEHPELWKVYNGIVTKYDDKTGEPIKWAKDDPNSYPVHIPPQNILGIATRTK